MNLKKTISKILSLEGVTSAPSILYYSYGKDSTTLLSILVNLGIQLTVFSSDILGCTEFDKEYHRYIENLFGITIHKSTSNSNNMESYITAREIMFQRDRSPLEGIGRYMDILGPIMLNHKHRESITESRYIFQGNTTGNSVILTGKDFTFQSGRTINPLYDWSDKDSMDYLNSQKILLHPVYNMGFSKNTCFPCFCWTNGEHLEFLENNIRLLKEHFKGQFDRWVKFETETGYPFFRKENWEPVYLKEYL